MKIFTIDADDNITVHANRKTAKSTGAATFSTETELAEAIGSDGKRLVGIWNSLPGVKPVTKFANRKVAAERIWKAIQSLGEPEAVATDYGLNANIGADTAQEVATPVSEATSTIIAEPAVSEPTSVAKTRVDGEPTSADAVPQVVNAPREGSKRAQVLALMSAPGGVSLAELMAATGWQKHSVRGFISGALVKKGIAVESFKRQDGQRAYRVNA
jgi:hypothetical protein